MSIKTILAALLFVVALPVHAQIAPDSLDEKLFQGVWSNDLPGVQSSLNAGANVFAKNMYGQTAADLAVDKGFFDIAHYLTQYMEHAQKKQKEAALPLRTVGVQEAGELSPPEELSPASVTPSVSPPVEYPVAQPIAPPVSPVVEMPPSPAPDEGPFALSASPQSDLVRVEEATSSPSDQNLSSTSGDPVTPQTITAAPTEPPAKPEPEPKAPVPNAHQSPDAKDTPDEPSQMDRLISAVSGFFSSNEPKPSESTPSQPQDEPMAEIVAEAATGTVAESDVKNEAESGAEDGAESKINDTQITFMPTPAPPPSGEKTPAHKISHQNLNGALKLPLGKALPEQRAKTPDACIMKPKAVAVCIEPTDWLEGVFNHFDELETSIFKRFGTGNRAVVGYRDNKAIFVQTIFPVSDFTAVTDRLTKLYGAPDVRIERTAAPLGKPRQSNPMLSWYGYDETAKRETVLQIINYDDTRSNYVNMAEGAVILKYVDEPSPFTYVTSIELIRIP